LASCLVISACGLWLLELQGLFYFLALALGLTSGVNCLLLAMCCLSLQLFVAVPGSWVLPQVLTWDWFLVANVSLLVYSSGSLVFGLSCFLRFIWGFRALTSSFSGCCLSIS